MCVECVCVRESVHIRKLHFDISHIKSLAILVNIIVAFHSMSPFSYFLGFQIDVNTRFNTLITTRFEESAKGATTIGRGERG